MFNSKTVRAFALVSMISLFSLNAMAQQWECSAEAKAAGKTKILYKNGDQKKPICCPLNAVKATEKGCIVPGGKKCPPNTTFNPASGKCRANG